MFFKNSKVLLKEQLNKLEKQRRSLIKSIDLTRLKTINSELQEMELETKLQEMELETDIRKLLNENPSPDKTKLIEMLKRVIDG